MMPRRWAWANPAATSRRRLATVRASSRPWARTCAASDSPVDKAHDEEHVAVDLVGAVDRDDVRVRHGAGGARFAKKTLAHGGVGREVLGERFDRHEPLEPPVAREIDDSHTAAPDHFLDRVVTRDRLGEGSRRVVEGAWIGSGKVDCCHVVRLETRKE